MLLKSISGVRGRGQKGLSPEEIEDFETAVAELEAAKGIEVPKELLYLRVFWLRNRTAKHEAFYFVRSRMFADVHAGSNQVERAAW